MLRRGAFLLAAVLTLASSCVPTSPWRAARGERSVPLSEVHAILEANARRERLWPAPDRYHALEVVEADVQRPGGVTRMTLTLAAPRDAGRRSLVRCTLELALDDARQKTYVEFAELRADGVVAELTAVGKLASARTPATGDSPARTTLYADVQLVPVRGGFAPPLLERADELLLTLVVPDDVASDALAIQALAAARPAVPSTWSCLFDPLRSASASAVAGRGPAPG